MTNTGETANAVDEIYQVNDENEILINDQKQAKSPKYNATEANPSTSNNIGINNTQLSSSATNLFGISNSRTCPTCHGSGKVNKDDQEKLVALIPLSDNRLKPKRIWLWILSTFIVCLIIAGSLTFTLAPRNISIISSKQDLHPINITDIVDFENKTIGINIFFLETYEITNNNYYVVHMKNLTLEVNRISHVTAPQIKYEKETPLKPRSTTEVSVEVKYVMYKETDVYVDLCLKEIVNELFALMTATFSFTTLWSNDLEVQLKSTQYIYCTNSSATHHIFK